MSRRVNVKLTPQQVRIVLTVAEQRVRTGSKDVESWAIVESQLGKALAYAEKRDGAREGLVPS